MSTANPHGARLERIESLLEVLTRIEIDCSVDDVWSTLIDFQAYPAWNPLITQICGEPHVGGTLSLIIAPPYLATRRLDVNVMAVREHEELTWLGTLWRAGILDGHHSIFLRRLGANRTELVHSEKFSGLLVPFVAPVLYLGMRSGFNAMNEALKIRVERDQTRRSDP